ncbi:TonB-dependent receptor [Flavobacteriaceae bacterium F08102]|nr:TonB-dependent receptor [Flavobacteriaceae bacterium F08102]
MKTLLALWLCIFCGHFYSVAQEATIKGRVLDQKGQPISEVSIQIETKGTVSNKDGYYSLRIPSGKMISVVFRHLSYETYVKRVRVPRNRSFNFSPKLTLKTELIDTVVIKDVKDKVAGVDKIPIETVKQLPSANAGVESTLKNIGLGVSGNNELSTQYNVRGGNYDENLVYVNGIQVYRPFLVRSGQQEGLSFVNSQMTQNVKFSAGGFQAKYGDKLSSVLDITYKTPKKNELAIEASLLGASLTFEGISSSKKFTSLAGIRYRNNSLFVNSKDVETNFKPSFTDIQTLFTYDANEQLSINFLGNVAINKYNYTPIGRRTNFGTITDPKALVVSYEGKEIDTYQTIFGALSADYQLNETTKFQVTSSMYNTQEEEYYDILAAYNLGDVNADIGGENFGKVEFTQAIGSQLDHARNDLDAIIGNLGINSTLRRGDYVIELGAKMQWEDLKDRIKSYQMIDSAGFSLRPPYLTGNDEPYSAYTGPIIPFTSTHAVNSTKIHRISGFAQVSKTGYLDKHQYWFNLGVRTQHWEVKSTDYGHQQHQIVSPRAQFTIKPDWGKDMLFRISGGAYSQAPFYHELRDSLGQVHPEVKAQKSVHLVLGNDYSFSMWERPFKLVSEVYYKSLSDVNPFTVNNVQIRYRAKNNAKAYAYGFDTRLNGEFVPGTESYFSFGYLKTEESIEDRGYIARPTDQRIKLAVLFQDYVPDRPNLKMYLNLIYNTGLPGGSPSYADPYIFNNRLKSYFRSDIGVSYVLKDALNLNKKKWLSKFNEFAIGVELFNMFDIQNTISNTWVRDLSSGVSVGVPNFLSGRVLNTKLTMKF